MTDFETLKNIFTELKIPFDYSDDPRDMLIIIDDFYFEFDKFGNFIKTVQEL